MAPSARGSRRVVRVAVAALADRPERTFSYRFPPGVGPLPEPGALLLVPYGRRLALGYLLGNADAEVPEELRDVVAVVSEPMLTPDLLQVAEAVAVYYRAPLGTTLAAMLPPGIESRLERRWRIADREALPAGALEVLTDGDEVEEATLARAIPDAAVRDRLRRAGALQPAWRLGSGSRGVRRVRVVRRTGSTAAAPGRAPLQAAILAELDGEQLSLPQLAERLGVGAATLLAPARRLEARGLVELGWLDSPRDALAHRPRQSSESHPLANEQRAALAAIAALAPGHELLLEGVAAAGKTEVYLAAIDATRAAGLGSLLLVPEVSLIPQLADRVAAEVGGEVTVLHSGLSAGERHDGWWQILRGDAPVVVGTRAAVFAPIPRLGLIILDEAHDGAYKSDRTPRYDARWVARRRAAATGARLVLGTATPSVADLSRVSGGLVDRACLVERRVGRAPRIEVVDLRAELAAGNRSVLSAALADALSELRPGEEQAILLINRRGTATFILCRDCGESVRCPDCDLPYVYHTAGDRLRCHHCGRTADPVDRCPRCGSRRIRYFGAGTQRVEGELRTRFPHLRTARLDSDAIAARRGFEAVYDDFVAGRADVLVGTQLAAKGLDLPSVTLVGVVAADVTLNLPDYLAAERTFQLLAQVAGRAGRGPLPGRVIIQTYAPEHHAVRAAAALDVDAFAAAELPRRRLLGYPPFSVLARLLVADPRRDRALERATQAAEAVRAPGVEVLGPLPAYVLRRAGRWRYQVVLRAADEASRAAALAQVPPGVAIDVDPESLL